jgi:hypothetical protein
MASNENLVKLLSGNHSDYKLLVGHQVKGNKLNEALIISGGFFHLAFAVFHLFFRRIFRWQPARFSQYLTALDSGKDLYVYINRAITQILNLCLIFVFFAAGIISIFYSHDLLSSNLGKIILISISGFWFLRLIEQITFFGFKKRFSIILSVLFALGCLIYIVPIIKL